MYKKIMDKYNEILNLGHSLSLLNWDQSTFIPINGNIARAEVIETLTKIFHEKISSDKLYEELCTSLESSHSRDLTENQKNELKKIKEDIELERKIPTKLAAEIAKTTSIGMILWQEAKKESDDKKYLSILEKIFKLKREVAELREYKENPYDALLHEFDKGLTYNKTKPLFEDLRNELKKIMNKISGSKTRINDDFLFKKCGKEKQESFGLDILKKMCIDFDSFRQDFSVHPFTTKIGNGDIRITTNISESDFKKGFFSTIHEGGHALYELGVSKIFGKSPFAFIDSLSLHESQSRFYENIIARNLIFWKQYYPDLQKIFNNVFGDIPLNIFYNAINKFELNPIRIESDELTYNLHIIIRFELENDMINNKLQVKNINEAWNEKTKKILGIYPENKQDGYLQDIHWSNGLIGYFPTYTMGNIISAQFYNKIINEIGPINIINDEVLKNIHTWFKENLYIIGSKKGSIDTVKTITGEEPNSKYFIKYLKEKYNSIYD